MSPEQSYLKNGTPSDIDLDQDIVLVDDTNRLAIRNAQIQFYKRHQRLPKKNQRAFVQSVVNYISFDDYEMLIPFLPYLTVDQMCTIITNNNLSDTIPRHVQIRWYNWLKDQVFK